MDPVERALDVALILMRNGGPTALADQAFQNVLKGYGLEGVSTIWRLDSMVACARYGEKSVTIVRRVGPIGINLARASEAAVLGQRVAKGQVDTDDLAAEIARVNAINPPYGRGVRIVAAAFAAAAFSKLAAGDWGAAGIVFVASGVGQFVRSLLQARKLAAAPVTLACGMLSACLAAVGLRLAWSHTPPAVAISSVIYMVPGLPLINGFMDVVSQRYLLVGLERIAHAAYLFLVLAIAIAFASAVIM